MGFKYLGEINTPRVLAAVAGGAFITALALFASCGIVRGNKGEASAAETAPVEIREEASRAPAAGRNIILVKGNEWITGFPGFKDNFFSSLYGEYRLELPGFSPPGEAAPPVFIFLWLSREPLYFPEDIWQRRSGVAGYTVLQKKEGEGLLAAAALDGGPVHGQWTVAFQFPQGVEALGLNDSEANQLIRTWISRFLYFLSLIKSPGDVSLPAIVNF
jgi:hypothetical protein